VAWKITAVKDDLPLVGADVVGWRSWRVVERWPGRWELQSLNSETVWRPREWLTATCHRGEPDPPHDHWGCGIHAAVNASHLEQLSYVRDQDVEAIWPDRGAHPVVIGRVQLAGKVIEGDKGWKAERGIVLDLWVPHHRPWIVAPVAARYRVPVHYGLTPEVFA
jgi:hypothetical protein